MGVKASYVVGLVEELAPITMAEDWDNSGWQLGDSDAKISAVVVALDPTFAALNKAKQVGAEILITHHPLIFSPLKHIRLDSPSGDLIAGFLEAGVGVYSAHTNLDNSPQGTSAVLAKKVGLRAARILAPRGKQNLYKLVAFVPPAHVENVRQALAKAGAGWTGNYSHCTFQAAGTGTFLPREGAKPYVGEIGKLEYTKEFRLETIVQEERLGQAIKGLLAAHPYEEVAYDIYPLARLGKTYGLGYIGYLPRLLSLAAFARQLKDSLDLPHAIITGDESRKVKKVAVCGGSGSSLIGQAAFQGADVFVTGDIKYHNAQEAALSGMAVIDAGHAGTENPVVVMMADYLKKKLECYGVSVHVHIASN
ncbi:MAG TPA: Nif3-like dinuclear metal center hexameric protein, partial [bacterium]|nr:Nif3-like dinuclear metal center hexameric protein [bacterium]